MFKRFFAPLFLVLFAASGLFAQTTVKTFSLSPVINNAGTPRIVRDGFKHNWLAAWRQTGPNKIVGRIVNSDGSLNAVKTLATAVSNGADSFDIFFDSTVYNYLLAFETAKGLQVQLFNEALGKIGQPTLIEGGVVNTSPRLNYDPVGKHFLIFWLSTDAGTPSKVLKAQVLDPNGKAFSAARSVSIAAAGKSFSGLSASANPKSGNFTVLTQVAAGTSASLLGFNIRRDGSSAGAPKTFQPTTPGFSTVADAAFVDAGTGFTFWDDKTSIKFRRVSAVGGFAGPTKPIANAADTTNSKQTSILFDSLNNQFLGVWGKGNTIQGVAINPATGALIKQPFTVATNNGASGSRDVATSYDGQVGNAIVVYDNAIGAKFQVQAAIFFVAGAGSQQGVSIGDNFFSPMSITIKQGSTLVWTHNGNIAHTVTSGSPSSASGLFDSGNLSRGQTFSFRFTTVGTISYFCRIHGAAMTGTITVQANPDGHTRY
jgi:plastocyanin